MSFSEWVFRIPWSVIAAAALLVALGWLGIARAEALAEGSGRFLRQQVVFSFVAAAALAAAAAFPYRILIRWAFAAFAVSLVLLVAVYFFPPINNAHRWIRLGPVGFQPSELAKVAYVLALARYLMFRDSYRRFGGMLLPLVLTLVPVVLILREPDLGTAMVFLPVFFVVLFAAGARRRDLALLALAGLATVPLLWVQMSREQRSRVTALFEQAGPGETPNDDTYHLRQAKQMLALGQTWGSLVRGPAVDDPAAYRLPEARSDFVFCVLGERLGLPGLTLVLGLYTVILWRGLAVAAATGEPFGRLVAVGVVAMFAVQAVINTAMTVGLLPITGLSLPLVSYGGSGLLAHGLLLGLLVSVALRPGYEVSREPFRHRLEGV